MGDWRCKPLNVPGVVGQVVHCGIVFGHSAQQRTRHFCHQSLPSPEPPERRSAAIRIRDAGLRANVLGRPRTEHGLCSGPLGEVRSDLHAHVARRANKKGSAGYGKMTGNAVWVRGSAGRDDGCPWTR